jgi:hypothetical protein
MKEDDNAEVDRGVSNFKNVSTKTDLGNKGTSAFFG